MGWGGEWKVQKSEWLKSRVDGWEAYMVGEVDGWGGKGGYWEEWMTEEQSGWLQGVNGWEEWMVGEKSG
jgi:hypothetical protein